MEKPHTYPLCKVLAKRHGTPCDRSVVWQIIMIAEVMKTLKKHPDAKCENTILKKPETATKKNMGKIGKKTVKRQINTQMTFKIAWRQE